MEETFLRAGNEGHLCADGRRVRVRIAEYTGKALRVEFPEQGMVGGAPFCWLEFEGAHGAASYYAQVCAATYEVDDGMVLVRVAGIDREGVREFARVPANCPVRVSGPDGRSTDAALVNISSGGAMVECNAEFTYRSQINIDIRIAGETGYRVLGQVVHIEKEHDGPRYRYGVRFVEVQRDFMRALFGYIWRQLRALFPGEEAKA